MMSRGTLSVLSKLALLSLLAGCPAQPRPIGVPKQCKQLETPFLVDGWAREVTAVRVDGCRVTPVPACQVKTLQNGQVREHEISRVAVDLPSLQAVLPLEADALKASLREGSVVVAQAKVDQNVEAELIDLTGDCAQATHYVSAMLVGSLRVSVVPEAELAQALAGPQSEGAIIDSQGVVALALTELAGAQALGCAASEKRADGSCPPSCGLGEYLDGDRCVRYCPQGERYVQAKGRTCELDEPTLPAGDPRSARLKQLLADLATPDADRSAVLEQLLCLYRSPEAIPPALLALGFRLRCAAPAQTAAKAMDQVDCWDKESMAFLLWRYAQVLQGSAEPADQERRLEISQRLLQEHPHSAFAASAYYEVADKLCSEGKEAEAVSIFSRIVADFPWTPSAKQARAREQCRPVEPKTVSTQANHFRSPLHDRCKWPAE